MSSNARPGSAGASNAGSSEVEKVVERYARRDDRRRYSMLQPANWQMALERQRAVLRLFNRLGIGDVSGLTLVEVGAGGGNNLQELIRFGFRPGNLTGIELLPERIASARQALPAGVRLVEGDALAAPIEPASADIVSQSLVFSSLLDDAFQERLAAAMWRWLKPGGGILWYDFTWNNPGNPDVRGVPSARVRQLFPEGRLSYRRVTLAPPLARRATRLHPELYRVLNAVPLLRTHILGWIAKPGITAPRE